MILEILVSVALLILVILVCNFLVWCSAECFIRIPDDSILEFIVASSSLVLLCASIGLSVAAFARVEYITQFLFN